MVDEVFIPKINSWLSRHGFSNATTKFDYEFCYAIDDAVISIGVVDYDEMGDWFKDFLKENGYDFSFIPYPILAFLHELGHHNTINAFSNEDLKYFSIVKELIPSDNEKEQLFIYWSFPDELAATRWLAEYVTTHMEDVAELTEIFLSTWDNVIDEVWEAL